jgi:hypothetical protein
VTIGSFVSEVLQALAPVLVTALVGLLSTAGAYLYSLVKAKLGAQAADKEAQYWSILQEVASHTVVAMQQSVVDRLKATGTWNDETAAQVKADAVTAALAGLGALKEQIGAQLKIDVPAMMELLLERALHDHKEFASATIPAETFAIEPRISISQGDYASSTLSTDYWEQVGKVVAQAVSRSRSTGAESAATTEPATTTAEGAPK